MAQASGNTVSLLTLLALVVCVSFMAQSVLASRPMAGRDLLQNEADYDEDYADDYDDGEQSTEEIEAKDTQKVQAGGWNVLLGIGCDDEPYAPELESTLKECLSKCNGDTGCHAFSYNFEKGLCYLKSTPCDVENPTKDDNISARKTSVGDGDKDWEYHMGTGCDEAEYHEEYTTIADCADMCGDDKDCLAYSYNLKRQKCYLKNTPCEIQNENKDTNISAKKTGN
mmetsp:Transcript_7481/g.21130  ORF Transcript_7481/g.21130 Transcript_7481/m.21130 type:complete len:226 (+) Transcript_7481:107-784(+)|eukprot:CAMPEP_0117663628 /NCGR_PEP_ID=MMETSP0804-20121206/8729_1 /TAXON_ID=1074897 /ORGANISM="Tetraselmis astigmatica, Strain CCMP880" /LENGTH=225 /DNA_ID=CAMNT_0005470689 /DNA_START=92 /DNA_END=769 /DNA_ORIENTATION=+